uniref:Uncharacterized protein n=1 Tax=Ananas comosus var. bracteatus TaxID=296719 RepID=A0A6V7P1Y1_ANACO|nr:unnamed protein product [Ananas comosus var. bracteatus]
MSCKRKHRPNPDIPQKGLKQRVITVGDLSTDRRRSGSCCGVETGSRGVVERKFADRTQFKLQEEVDERRRGFGVFFDELATRFRVAMSFRLCGHPENHCLALLASHQGSLMCSKATGGGGGFRYQSGHFQKLRAKRSTSDDREVSCVPRAFRCVFGIPSESENRFWETDLAGGVGFVSDIF